MDFIEKIKNTKTSEIDIKTVLGVSVDPKSDFENEDEVEIKEVVREKKFGTLIFPDKDPIQVPSQETILSSAASRVISPGRRSLIIITGEKESKKKMFYVYRLSQNNPHTHTHTNSLTQLTIRYRSELSLGGARIEAFSPALARERLHSSS